MWSWSFPQTYGFNITITTNDDHKAHLARDTFEPVPAWDNAIPSAFDMLTEGILI